MKLYSIIRTNSANLDFFVYSCLSKSSNIQKKMSAHIHIIGNQKQTLEKYAITIVLHIVMHFCTGNNVND